MTLERQKINMQLLKNFTKIIFTDASPESTKLSSPSFSIVLSTGARIGGDFSLVFALRFLLVILSRLGAETRSDFPFSFESTIPMKTGEKKSRLYYHPGLIENLKKQGLVFFFGKVFQTTFGRFAG